MIVDQSDQKTHRDRRSRRLSSTIPVSIPDTINPFRRGRAEATRLAFEGSAPSTRTAHPAGLGPAGEGHLQLDVSDPGGWPQADEGDRILFQEFRLACDRRVGRQTRDEVIAEHDRTVKIGNHVPDPEPSRSRLDPRPAADRLAAETVDPADDEATVVVEDPD